VPLLGVNHLRAHVEAAQLEHGELEPPLAALVVSGGHTSIVAMDADANPGERAKPLDTESDGPCVIRSGPRALEAAMETIRRPPCIPVEQSSVRSMTRASASSLTCAHIFAAPSSRGNGTSPVSVSCLAPTACSPDGRPISPM
jgi:hypothetical protein